MKPKQRHKVSNYLCAGAITLSVLAVISCLIPLTTKLSSGILQILNVGRCVLSILSIITTIISMIIIPDRLFISIALIQLL